MDGLNVEVEKKNSFVELSINLNNSSVKNELDKAYRNLEKTARIPGFRSGKVPREILEVRFGKRVEKEVVNTLISNAYAEAIKRVEVTPVSYPKIRNVRYEKNKSLSFQAAVEIKPKIEIDDYKGISLEKKVIKVTDNDVEENLVRLQEMYGELDVVEGRDEVRKGDVITLDYEGFINGKAIPNAKGENAVVEVGKTVLVPGAEEKLIGCKKNRWEELKVVFPKDHPDKEVAGMEGVFKVFVKEIKEKRLPPLDDEFAKDVGFNTLEELKRKVKEDLKASAEIRMRTALQEDLLRKLSGKVDVVIPNTMIEKEINCMIRDFSKTLRPKTLDSYLKEQNITIERLRADFRSQAIENVKRVLIIEEIANRENIEVGEEDIAQRVRELAEEAGLTFDEMKKKLEKGGLKNLKEEVRIIKTLKFLLENSHIREV
jgi:trigger factor